MPRPSRATLSTVALGGVTLLAGAIAIALHRHGHAQGDDFALYLRQARSLFEGDTSQVVADNRFTVLNSTGRFSPIAYPWGWPLALSPFVHLWGFDYDRLKIVVVVLFCIWLVLVHGIVRRRGGPMMALLIVAAIGLCTTYLGFTDQLLSEYPYLVVVALTIWWIDRVHRRSPLHEARPGDLAVLGVLAALAFNVRREGLVLVAVMAVAQIADIAGHVRTAPERPSTTVRSIRWQVLAVPYLAFGLAAGLAQLVLPSDLLPGDGGGLHFVRDRLWGDYPEVVTAQLGLGEHRTLGLMVLALALAGVVVRCWRAPTTDAPLAALMLLSALAVSTHFRLVPRYYLQITPWVLYFAVSALAAAAALASSRRPTWAPWVVRGAVAAPLVALLVIHAAVLPGDIADARDFDRAGGVQMGPAHPDVEPVFDAVRRYTAPDDVVAYFKSRTMTLLTERRAIQAADLDIVLRTADWFAMQRGSTRTQPLLTVHEAEAAGLSLVWQDDSWILWRVDRPPPTGG